jgi:hypothetical protein
LERDAGQVVNRSKTQVYSPNGNYAGMPQAFQIGTITATLTGEDGVPAVVTAQGLTIWGVALSKDDNYIKAAMAIKAEEVCNTINKVTNSFNLLSKDVTLAVLRLSLQPRAQYHQQTHQSHLVESANKRIQKSLDWALELVTGLDLLNPAAYSQDPVNLQDPALGAERVAQPARHKGLGLRRIDDFVGSAAYVGGIELVSRRLIDKRGKMDPFKQDSTLSLSRSSALASRTTEMKTNVLPSSLTAPAQLETASAKPSSPSKPSAQKLRPDRFPCSWQQSALKVILTQSSSVT